MRRAASLMRVLLAKCLEHGGKARFNTEFRVYSSLPNPNPNPNRKTMSTRTPVRILSPPPSFVISRHDELSQIVLNLLRATAS